MIKWKNTSEAQTGRSVWSWRWIGPVSRCLVVRTDDCNLPEAALRARQRSRCRGIKTGCKSPTKSTAYCGNKNIYKTVAQCVWVCAPWAVCSPWQPGLWHSSASTFFNKNMKKRSEWRKHCALAVVRRSRAKNFRPAADPLPGGAGRPKFNQLKMVTTFTYRPSLVKIHARNFELSW